MVDLPAPFSPMSACTSPGNRRRLTSARAGTPPNAVLMSSISTMGEARRAGAPGAWGAGGWESASERAPGGWTSICVITLSSGGSRDARRARSDGPDEHSLVLLPDAGLDGSVLAVGQDLGRLGLIEGALLGDDPGGDLLTLDDLLGEVHQLWPEERVALHDVVDLALGERGHAVLDRIDRDDLDVLAGGLAGRLDGLDGTEALVVVVGEDDLDVLLGLQERLHPLLAAVTRE